MKEQLIVKTGYESPAVSIYHDILQSPILQYSGDQQTETETDPNTGLYD